MDTGAVGTVAEFRSSVTSGELMRLDTWSMPAGRYAFGLVVIDETGNSYPEIAEVLLEIN
jgi:hypothetical protein